MRSKHMQQFSRYDAVRRREISPQVQWMADSPDSGREVTLFPENRPALTPLHEEMFDDLMDLCGAEAHLVDALSVLANASSAATVKAALNAHLEQARVHLRLLATILAASASRRSDESVFGAQSAAMSTIVSDDLVSDIPSRSTRSATSLQQLAVCEHSGNGSPLTLGRGTKRDERAALLMVAMLDSDALGELRTPLTRPAPLHHGQHHHQGDRP